MTTEERNSAIRSIGEKTGLLVAIRYHTDPKKKQEAEPIIRRLEQEIDALGKQLYPPLGGIS